MAFCTNCGNQIPDGVKFCTVCGAALTGEAAPQPKPQPAQQPQAQPQPPHQQSVYQQQPYQQPYTPPYMEEPISTGGYIGIFLLMMVPVINLICLLVWACGGCKKVNKRNLSRAMLVLMLIGIVLGGLIAVAGSLLFGDIFSELETLGNTLQQP